MTARRRPSRKAPARRKRAPARNPKRRAAPPRARARTMRRNPESTHTPAQRRAFIEHAEQELVQARAERAAARWRMESAKTRKARLTAEEDLNYWQGKVAMLEVGVARGPGGGPARNPRNRTLRRMPLTGIAANERGPALRADERPAPRGRIYVGTFKIGGRKGPGGRTVARRGKTLLRGSRLAPIPMEHRIYAGTTARRVDSEGTGLHIYVNDAGRPTLTIFRGKGAKPIANYNYRSAEARAQHLRTMIDAEKRSLGAKQVRVQERRSSAHGYKVGDVLYASWGYDQTNVNFYEVTRVVSAKSIVVREIGKRVDHSSGDSADYVMPVPGHFVGAAMTKRVGSDGHILVGHTHASAWNGKPKYQTGWAAGH